MIHIFKSLVVPPLLDGDQSRGGLATSELAQRFDAGEVLFDFTPAIYGHPDVRAALRRDQHGKCAFCELDIEDGDVEHFRPKKAWKQNIEDELQRPGYYWLAYEWDNLVLSCSHCNQREKRNLFPLRNPKSRATSHKHPISKEKPWLIHPTQEHPEKFIAFKSEFVVGVDKTGRGKRTIATLKLDRPWLADKRREHLVKVKHLLHGWKALVKLNDPRAVESEDFLVSLTQPNAKFSAATSAFLKAQRFRKHAR